MAKQQPKKRAIDPQAAKILEQYRAAKGGIPAAEEGGPGPDGTGGGAAQRPAGPPPAAQMRRSGTRGK
jgi:hypothetical protein